jgi:hypothetical protein
MLDDRVLKRMAKETDAEIGQRMRKPYSASDFHRLVLSKDGTRLFQKLETILAVEKTGKLGRLWNDLLAWDRPAALLCARDVVRCLAGIDSPIPSASHGKGHHRRVVRDLLAPLVRRRFRQLGPTA